MKIRNFKSLSLIVIFLMLPLNVAYATETSVAPSNDNIIVTNNVTGKSDTVYVTGINAGDVVKVYNAASDGTQLGTVTVASSKTYATVTIPQLGTSAGSVYVSVTSKGELESDRTQVNYDAELQSDAPDANNITVTNNAGISDTVYVTGLNAGDVVKVYNAASQGTLLGTTTATSSNTDATVTRSQLGKTAGSVYVSVTTKGELESSRTQVSYDAEGQSNSLAAGNITVTNNARAADTVYVTGVSASDVVKVYNAAAKGSLLGKATVASYKYDATVAITQLGTTAGNVYVSVTTKGQLESNRTQVGYYAETPSYAPSLNNITVTNNITGKADKVYVTGLNGSDVIKVYNAASQGTLLGTATVASSQSDATVTISQLGTTAGSVYISITSKNNLESSRTQADYVAEAQSDAPNAGNITVTNNPAGTSDTVYVTWLNAGDVVKVYDAASKGTLLGTATVASSNTYATVTIKQLGISAGSIYVSVTSTSKQESKQESSRTQVDYDSEVQSDAPTVGNITVTNNPNGTSDTVYVTGLTSGDVVKVYNAASKGTQLGTATVASSKVDATVTITQLGTTAGSVYVSVTSTNKQESSRTQVGYVAEANSSSLSAGNITVTNNSNAPDTVYITGLTANDVVKVYDSATGGTQLGTATVGTYSSTATVTITQLGITSGSIYVSVTSKNKLESSRLQVSYAAEGQSSAPVVANITISNNAGASDTVYVTGLASNDVVKVYDSATGANQIGTATAGTSYSTNATVTIAQLGTTAGSIYVSVTSTDKLESSLTKVDYAAEAQSSALVAENITVTNNAVAADTVRVTGLAANDIVKVYDSATGGNQLGTATVGTSSSTATVTIAQLGTIAGSIYVSVTSTDKLESSRLQVSYAAEGQSSAPVATNITIVNNAGQAGTVNVTGLVDNDIVNVYDSPTGGNLLGTATVPAYSTAVTVSIPQLGTSAGSVYVSVTSTNKQESSRTAADFSAKSATDAPVLSSITVVNNSGIADTVTVTGLAAGDVINVYNAASGGSLLGSGTVSTDSMEADISITQLGTVAGSIYVSNTTAGKTESVRTTVAYSAEQASDEPLTGNVTIINNPLGTADTITVDALLSNDVVNVYNAASGGSLLGTATASSSTLEATLSIAQLGAGAGSVYISVTSSGKPESGRVQIDYLAESTTPNAANITVTNNVGISDTVYVSGLTTGDEVKVYNSASGGSLLGSATVSSNSTQVTVSIAQLGSSAGSVYVSVTSLGRTESNRLKADYTAEPSSPAPYIGNITVTNNAGISDTVTVANLTASDVIMVYDAATGGNLLGYATVPTGSTEATVTINQLGTDAGSVYVSVTSKGMAESGKTEADYIAEQSSTAPYVGYITIINNTGTSDTVTETNLTAGDIIKVYNAASGGSLLGYAIVSTGSTSATVTIPQIGVAAGSVYVTTTSYGETESNRTKADFIAEIPT
ncbi:conserved exported hypothetical protein [Candidatus Desulfosporosinus infrequens]|uniref:Uncharacterized protein n=1 Tax=Candidatus Desulfosporosinus infrequens TaxID=2043169 RepID=A0A2U3KC55_9FIRM|nr:conserved exported hypothetical protein [Candidatus Desulfosporosinus infrequens]